MYQDNGMVKLEYYRAEKLRMIARGFSRDNNYELFLYQTDRRAAYHYGNIN